MTTNSKPKIGVLALQGDFEAHGKVLLELGAIVREVRVPAQLDGLDGLVIPGGESTTIRLGLEREKLTEPIREKVNSGLPVFGTCAGMIILDRSHLNLIDITCERNAFGRQIMSFELDMNIAGVDFDGNNPIRAVFIRAPWVKEWGTEVEVLASIDDHPVAVRQKNRLAISFHPEIAGELRMHRLFLEMVTSSG